MEKNKEKKEIDKANKGVILSGADTLFFKSKVHFWQILLIVVFLMSSAVSVASAAGTCTGTAPNGTTQFMCPDDNINVPNTGLVWLNNGANINGCSVGRKCEYRVPTAPFFSIGGLITGNSGTLKVNINSGILETTMNNWLIFEGINNGTYTLNISASPAGQTCTFNSNNSASRQVTVNGANVTGVDITCADTVFSCQGATPNGTTQIMCPGDNTGLPSNLNWISVATCTTGRKCEYTAPSTYQVAGTITGASSNFGIKMDSGTVYSVKDWFNFPSVANGNHTIYITSPTGQTCTFNSNNSASRQVTVNGANVTGVDITCVNFYTCIGTAPNGTTQFMCPDDNINVPKTGLVWLNNGANINGCSVGRKCEYRVPTAPFYHIGGYITNHTSPLKVKINGVLETTMNNWLIFEGINNGTYTLNISASPAGQTCTFNNSNGSFGSSATKQVTISNGNSDGNDITCVDACITLGDFDCNGKYDAMDLNFMIGIILKSNPTTKERAKGDMNSDNVVNALDLNVLIDKILNHSII